MKDEKSAVGFTDFKGYRSTQASVTHGYCVHMYVGSVCATMLLFKMLLRAGRGNYAENLLL